MFDVGQEVVCIDASSTNIFGDSDLVKGKHYIIDWIGMYDDFGQQILCVQLAGVKRSIPILMENYFRVMGMEEMISFGSNVPFRATRFAPLRKTDISALQSLLEPTEKEKVLEDV